MDRCRSRLEYLEGQGCTTGHQMDIKVEHHQLVDRSLAFAFGTSARQDTGAYPRVHRACLHPTWSTWTGTFEVAASLLMISIFLRSSATWHDGMMPRGQQMKGSKHQTTACQHVSSLLTCENLRRSSSVPRNGTHGTFTWRAHSIRVQPMEGTFE